MSIYIMSDVHGMYDKYVEMLNIIGFNVENDYLYVLGDIFDRGPKPLEILEHIVTHKNIELILGNHEEFFLNCYDIGTGYDLWYQNGGEVTHRAIVDKGQLYKDYLYTYLSRCKLYQTIDSVPQANSTYNTKTYFLCHAGIKVPRIMPKELEKFMLEEILGKDEKENILLHKLDILQKILEYEGKGGVLWNKEFILKKILETNKREDYLWNRDHINDLHTLNDFEIICGHTPTPLAFDTNDVVKHGCFNYIDCGVCFDEGRLSCIKITENGYETFYV